MTNDTASTGDSIRDSSSKSDDYVDTDDTEPDEVDLDNDIGINDLSLIPNDDGWIDGNDNRLGIQGLWYEFSDYDYSEIERYDISCAEGTIAQVVEDDDGYMMWNDIWGGGIGFNLCLTNGDQDPPDEKFTLEECPLNEYLDMEFLGIIFELEGDIGEGALRVTFAEGQHASAYVEILDPGYHEVLLEDARILWDTDNDQPYADLEEVHSVQFALPPNDNSEYEFDFCINNVKAIATQVI